MEGDGFQGRRGQTLVELALLMPFLLWICMGIVDFGRIYYYDNIAINAARSGARVAADSTKFDTDVQAAISADIAGRLSVVSVVINPTAISPHRRTPGDNVTVTVTYRFTTITPLIGRLIGNSITVSRSATMTVIY